MAYKGFVHCLTYEALSANPRAVVADMLAYLGMSAPSGTILRMIGEASFEKQTARDSKSEGRERGEENIESSFRKGVVGDWKNHIPEGLAREIDGHVADIRQQIIGKFSIKNYGS